MDLQKTDKEKRIIERVLIGILFGISMLSTVLFAAIVFWLLKNGLPTLNAEFLMTKTSVIEGKIGIREYLLNTWCILLSALFLAGVMGIMTTIYICEYGKNQNILNKIHFAIEILAGIPSIVFGLFGMVFFGEGMKLGYSLLTGSLTLTIMVLPIVIKSTKMAIEEVPDSYKMGALSLGAGKWYMVRTILLPEAVSGIASGLTLSAGKILGESAALLFTAGSKGSLSVAIYLFLSKGWMEEAYASALLLLGMMFMLNLLLQMFREKKKHRK